MKTMDQLKPGETGVAAKLPEKSAASLARLGLVPGAEVRCLRRTPLGDPTVYLLRGTALALRRRDTAGILLAPAAEVRKGGDRT